jgi:hypothetical protein
MIAALLMLAACGPEDAGDGRKMYQCNDSWWCLGVDNGTARGERWCEFGAADAKAKETALRQSKDGRATCTHNVTCSQVAPVCD